jgi:hypothetical protein
MAFFTPDNRQIKLCEQQYAQITLPNDEVIRILHRIGNYSFAGPGVSAETFR